MIFQSKQKRKGAHRRTTSHREKSRRRTAKRGGGSESRNQVVETDSGVWEVKEAKNADGAGRTRRLSLFSIATSKPSPLSHLLCFYSLFRKSFKLIHMWYLSVHKLEPFQSNNPVCRFSVLLDNKSCRWHSSGINRFRWGDAVAGQIRKHFVAVFVSTLNRSQGHWNLSFSSVLQCCYYCGIENGKSWVEFDVIVRCVVSGGFGTRCWSSGESLARFESGGGDGAEWNGQNGDGGLV